MRPELTKGLKRRSKRKYSKINTKKEVISSELPYSTLLLIKKMKSFMTLLSDSNINIELVKQFDYEWYQWLYLWYNPKTKHKKVIGFEDIPFYHIKLENDFFNLYQAIVHKAVFLKDNFLQLNVSHTLTKKSYNDLFLTKGTLETLEKINLNGAFYYKLPNKYTFFEMFIENRQVNSTEILSISKAKLTKLSKHLLYFGIIEHKGKLNKPYFINYYSKEEVSKKYRFRCVERMNLLKNTLKEKGILNNVLEGNLIWDIDDIPNGDRKNDVLVVYSKGALFDNNECFILTKEE